MDYDDILFIDLEVRKHTGIIEYVGAVIGDATYKGQSVNELKKLYNDTNPKYLCGHNFINHDKTFLSTTTFNPTFQSVKIIDTYYLSMLLFPDKLSHKLDKPYKIDLNIQNDPLGDCFATKELFHVLMDRFNSLPNYL